MSELSIEMMEADMRYFEIRDMDEAALKIGGPYHTRVLTEVELRTRLLMITGGDWRGDEIDILLYGTTCGQERSG